MNLDVNQKLDIEEILKDLENYRPRRKGWTWRKKVEGPTQVGPFVYKQISQPLKNSIGLPASKYFGDIDPQPDCVITSEIASGRFEDDIRRMRMAAWHGADHIMVIRTAGQSHYDGLIEGTPEGIGGVPITRKQIRASRKALDMIEDEVGRPINLHSYVSGVAGPDIAVLFAEEGVNGAHQDPQYNILYRNVNMYRSFVDAAVAKKIMASADMLQIDGAHNANATAREAWKVMPELMVQHGINAMFSTKVGMKKENISLSTVPPTAPPAPCMALDLPYAVALRELFDEYKMRAQMNTKYMESCTREATVSHTLNLMISRLTSADIQSTITPDEGRNVPWHYNNIHAVNTAKQALIGLDAITDYVQLKEDGPLREKVRELKERAILFLEEIIATGGYFKAVEEGFFVDSGYYPERNGDGIVRKGDGGIGSGTIFLRDEDYFAPVCHHFGYNNIPKEYSTPCQAIDGCTLCKPEKIHYIDELDEEDNVNQRLEKKKEHRQKGLLTPEVEWYADGYVSMNIFLPTSARVAEYAAIEIAKKMGLTDVEAIHKQPIHPAEGTLVEVKGRLELAIDPQELKIPEEIPSLSEEEIREDIKKKPMKVVAATVGEDEHSVGMREIIDIKHGGIEKFGIQCHYLGTSVSVAKAVDAAIEIGADAILISTIITHGDIHRINMRRLHQLCKEKGIRDKIILVAGGTQVTNDIAVEEGMDAGFGRGTKGIHVASFLVKRRRELAK
ncbi:D-ornithine 4,5-aminomutase E subunit [Anaerobranca californiensis DSM 14826]|jgi:D-ornithine 4,5-aminomutase subunit beta|uniref:D-ornithine 4,5-aminomutase E subunit n=1 Tax=Anaerobranca californiensis DSM 14826 TaxID=1120989 RepID=A0A1M6MYQ6_9FIRM|nr:D-ornithine 4,5-aminomutase subunit OraE [Anaerobranca californiensis]SHJ88463.1 D-ornithine 4,5-aminomutase E subunit [Anaerobranca californiensis DSM 14826]